MRFWVSLIVYSFGSSDLLIRRWAKVVRTSGVPKWSYCEQLVDSEVSLECHRAVSRSGKRIHKDWSGFSGEEAAFEAIPWNALEKKTTSSLFIGQNWWRLHPLWLFWQHFLILWVRVSVLACSIPRWQGRFTGWMKEAVKSLSAGKQGFGDLLYDLCLTLGINWGGIWSTLWVLIPSSYLIAWRTVAAGLLWKITWQPKLRTSRAPKRKWISGTPPSWATTMLAWQRMGVCNALGDRRAPVPRFCRFESSRHCDCERRNNGKIWKDMERQKNLLSERLKTHSPFTTVLAPIYQKLSRHVEYHVWNVLKDQASRPNWKCSAPMNNTPSTPLGFFVRLQSQLWMKYIDYRYSNRSTALKKHGTNSIICPSESEWIFHNISSRLLSERSLFKTKSVPKRANTCVKSAGCWSGRTYMKIHGTEKRE